MITTQVLTAPVRRKDGKEERVNVYSAYNFPFEELKTKALNCKKKKPKQYLYDFATFDIETTTIEAADRPYGFMYHWQMCVGGKVVIGRYWKDWIYFCKELARYLELNPERRFVVYVHNLAFECQFIIDFIREYLDGYEVFARGSRKPIYINTGIGIEFRCSYTLSNMGLKKACENERGITYLKADGDLDYRVIRTPETILTDTELGYCVSDVVCLYDFIKCRLKNEHDNISSIPLTSTGYVRRDCRRACRRNKYYSTKVFKKLKVTKEVYTLLKEAGRGGNTHANRKMSGRIWHEVDSFDAASMYPAMMTLRQFPMSAFTHYGKPKDIKDFYYHLQNYACLFQIRFINLRVKQDTAMPYIPSSKCWERSGDCAYDNGRVLSGTVVAMTLTDVDFNIIASEYKWDGFEVIDLYRAEYGMLPEELRNTVLDYFRQKSELKEAIKEAEDAGDDLRAENLQYLYAKSKNRLNGIFGMCYTDPVRESITIDDSGQWTSDFPDIEEALRKYCNNRNNFLYYAWGVWITAWARDWLEHLINACSSGEEGAVIYCDTDSSKCINPNIDEINRLNNEVMKLADELGAYADVKGTRYYMGVFEHENKKPIINFKTLGAKKYCYTDEKGFHITISGVEKKKGAKEMGNIENFTTGFCFKEAGGTTLYYNDDRIHTINIEGCEIETASNIGITDSTYVLGVTDDYARLIGLNLILDNSLL